VGLSAEVIIALGFGFSSLGIGMGKVAYLLLMKKKTSKL
jgi:hypothetical protein